MYKALFLLCFHACRRAGEVVHSNKSTHTLQKHQFVKTKSGYKINFHSYKHSSGRTTTMQLEASNAKYCAVKKLRAFLKLRGNVCGALLTKHNEKPFSRQEFSRSLRDCLERQGFPSASYNTHSFRIGRATQLSMDNATDAVISNTGRWKVLHLSNIYVLHILPPPPQVTYSVITLTPSFTPSACVVGVNVR